MIDSVQGKRMAADRIQMGLRKTGEVHYLYTIVRGIRLKPTSILAMTESENGKWVIVGIQLERQDKALLSLRCRLVYQHARGRNRI